VTKIYYLRWSTDLLGYVAIIGILALGLMIILSPYRMEQVSAVLHPWEGFDKEDCGSFAGISPALSCAVLQLGQRASR
jgi:hypothetical protein